MSELAAVRLLIVDDSDLLRDTLAELLRREGWEIETASHGADGLAKVYTTRDAYHVVLLDLNMPIMDGWEVLASIRKDPNLSSVRVVILSAYLTEQADLNHAIERGADACLRKGFSDIPEIVRTIRSLVTTA
jgi:CheY-like chemotaxis protein